MKKYINTLKHKIIFRCDAADIPELGTGHLYRSLIIANYLKNKFSIRDEHIGFLIKTDGKYKKSIKILKNHKFTILKLNSKIKDYSKEEYLEFNKHKSNLLIIDRLGKINKNFFNKINNNFSKKIIIDDSSKYRDFFDLSLNPLIQNVKTLRNSKIGYKYLILQNYKRNKILVKNNNIFMFFGGYDRKKLSLKVLKLLDCININLNIMIPTSYKEMTLNKKFNHKLIYFEPNQYLSKLYSSNIAITAGGIGLFDAILAKKKIICFSQYIHQEINTKKVDKLGAAKFFDINDRKIKIKFCNIFLETYNNKNYEKSVNNIQNQVINIKMLNETFNLISNIYEKSANREAF